MNHRERLSAIGDRIQDHAGVTQVYGDPVEHDGKTIVPVAKVAYGFGGGYESEGREDVDTAGENRDAGEGGGMGGGVWATPIGVVEITNQETRFIPFGDTRKRAVVAGLCFVFGYVLGRK
ncbi:GerW family sporulation protein [Natrinema halophilum]|uniref:Sporulation protein YtfJ n=1 Tax=Natrinema halophilum TaxID=1699371 RepID=A0A7D5GPN6_9EURY|nr:spore germination protein GerW family protein [Natrinema halophilum]QLG50613.1 sporulation protein YtfJ [Natrinema halophilum]